VILKYTLTLEEYVESHKVYRIRMAKSRVLFRNLYGLACVTVILGIYLRFAGRPWWAALLFLLATILLAERLFLWRRHAAASYQSNSGIREPTELLIEESNLVRTSPAGSDEIRWANIVACHETGNLFLLRLDTNELLVIPKRAFSPGDLSRFKELRQRELIVNTTRDNPDLVLLRFVASWAVLAIVFMALFIGYVHTFLTELPKAPRRNRPASGAIAVSSPTASLSELRGRGTVYLVPFGEIDPVSVPRLAQDIQERYKLQVHLLPPISPPEWAKDPARKQFVAEDLVDALKLAYPKLGADRKAVIIGLTNEDMYISGLRWKYAFSFREEERFAIISSARLFQGEEDQKPVSPQVVQKRVTKLLIRDVGILYYRLQPSYNYKSILYREVVDPSDLDTIGDDFLKQDALVRAELHVENGDPCLIVRHSIEAPKQHPESGIVNSCSGYYKNPDLETVQIDLRYGLLLDQRTDFLASDTIPLELTRVLRTQDPRSRAFGIGGNHSFNIFLVGDKWPFTWIDLVLEHGGRSHFRRSNWGFGYWDAHYTNRDRNESRFIGSTIDWAWPGWKLNNSGITYRFADAARATRPEQAALIGIQNYSGAQLVLARDTAGNLLRARSPAGKELVFKYDSSNRVTGIYQRDGGHFEYSYEPTGHLARVTDAGHRVTDYTYDQSGRLNRIVQDGAEICRLTYDAKDRVQSETLASGRTYFFQYYSNNQLPISQVDISDSAGPKRTVRLSFVEYSLDTTP